MLFYKLDFALFSTSTLIRSLVIDIYDLQLLFFSAYIIMCGSSIWGFDP